MVEEYSALNYFHGALLDEDADKLLKMDGDFLVQSKDDGTRTRPKLMLAVKKGRVRRFELSRAVSGGFRILGQVFPTVKVAIEHFQSRSLNLGNGEVIQLKRAVPKGKFQLTHKDIKLREKIGSGAYGTVYRGILIKENIAVAMKRIDSDGKSEQGLVDMMKEARVMQLYDHKNIVKFYGFVVDRTPYLLVMELCTDGSVEDKLRSKGRAISTARRVDMCVQASRGLEYLHLKKCIHRDIATRNCLLSASLLKLADFGMCRATAIYKVDLSKPQNVRWLAPEVWRTGETKFCTDVFAFGIMLWEMFEIPYVSPYCTWKAITVKERVMVGYRMATPESMPDAMSAVMKKAWDQDPTKRPTASEIRCELETIGKEFTNEIVENSEFKPPTVATTPKTARSRSTMLDTASKLGRSLQTAVGSRPRTPPRSDVSRG